MNNKLRCSLLAIAIAFSACTRDEAPEEYSEDNLPRATSTIMPPGGKADRPGEYLSFQEFLQHVFCEDDGRICVVDGDTPITGGFAGLRDFYDTRVQPSLGTHQQALSVNRRDRGDDVWYGDDRHNLSFCVSDEFGERKAEVVEATLAATRAWEEIASVTFPYRADQDHRCHLENRQVLFPIWPAEEDAPYFARAFFPSFQEHERDIRINLAEFDSALQDPSTADLTLEGIMRHELGHVLGFRHEHTRSEAGAYHCFEDWNYRPGTDYDAHSVMHYPHCEGSNDWALEFSDFDALGAAYFYPPDGIEILGRCDEEIGPDGYVLESCEPVVRQITEWLSKYNFSIFLEWAGISESLWERIQQESFVRPFESLQDLRDRVDLLDAEIRQVYDYLFFRGRCPGWEFSEDEWVLPLCYPVVNQILFLANNASFDELNDEVGLDRRAVANIVAAREVRQIDSYDGLISLGYVKRVALWSMYTYLFPNWAVDQLVEDLDTSVEIEGCGSFPTNSLALPNCGEGPLTVSFDASPFLAGLEYSDPTWNFGDGRTGRGVQADHTYLVAGDFQATFSARISGVGWQSTVQLGSLDVRVLQGPQPDLFETVGVQSYRFDGLVTIPPGEWYLSTLEIGDCPSIHEVPIVSINFDNGTQDQIDLSLLAPGSEDVFHLWDGTDHTRRQLNSLFFPVLQTPVTPFDSLVGTLGRGQWILDITNISDQPVAFTSWIVTLQCERVYSEFPLQVDDGSGEMQAHNGAYPSTSSYVGYGDNESAQPGDSGYRAFLVPGASTTRITVLFNVEENYDQLHIRDDVTGELLFSGTGPTSSGSYQLAEVDVPSNAFSIGVVSDASVNRPQSWRLVEVEIDP